MKAEDKSTKLRKVDKLIIQKVTCTFLYYALSVAVTILVALSAIKSDLVSLIKETMRKTKQFFVRVACHPNVILTFSASSIVLAVHSDVSYLTGPKARSRAEGHFFMSDES